jgi:putative two-component system response regulator
MMANDSNKPNRRIRVLAVDDDASAISVIEAYCMAADFDLHYTREPTEAFELAKTQQPDVIISDVMMPGLNGFEVCAQIKADPETALIPILMVTALDSRDDRLKGIEAGCDDFMTKPVDRLIFSARVRSLARIRGLTSDLDDAKTVLSSLALSVEAKDGTTGDHCERLTQIGRLFGKFLHLSEPDIRALESGGVLHDIGKIGIPDAVLLKPGKLTDEEWVIMRTHVTIGYDLLRPLRTMQRVSGIVRHHHERFDGKGYPDGLVGEDIPYLARVFQIFDAFDALTSKRPYKPPFSIEKSLGILDEEKAQGKWDPELIDKFHAFFEENKVARQIFLHDLEDA